MMIIKKWERAWCSGLIFGLHQYSVVFLEMFTVYKSNYKKFGILYNLSNDIVHLTIFYIVRWTIMEKKSSKSFNWLNLRRVDPGDKFKEIWPRR